MESQKNKKTFEEWQKCYENATVKMKECRERSKRVFIEAAAQHPLVEGLYPGWEFSSRLRVASQMLMNPTTYLDDASLYPQDVFIYVPGGRHQQNGVEDVVSLSEAGLAWLRSQVFGLQDQLLGGDETNLRLTDGRGIFNGEDECAAAARMFEELGAGRFICVCSQGQMMRKALAYIQLGYYPEFVVLPGTHHSPVWEAFKAIPKMLADGEVMSEESRASRIAGSSNNTVFVYHEYQDDKPYGEQIVKVFYDENAGREYLRKRTEIVLGRTWDGLKATAGPEDTVDPTHVSVNEGGVCKFFILDGKLPTA